MMRTGSATASVHRGGLRLQRDRKDCSDERNTQQNPGGQTLHDFPVKQNP